MDKEQLGKRFGERDEDMRFMCGWRKTELRRQPVMEWDDDWWSVAYVTLESNKA